MPLPQQVRNRVLTAVALFCGSLAAGLFWRNYRPLPPEPQLSDAQAIQRGFSSAQDWRDEHAARAKYMNDLSELHRFDADDMAFAQKTLTSGSDTARLFLFTGLKYIADDQHSEVIKMLGTCKIRVADHSDWLDTFGSWEKRDATVASLLKHSSNPDVVSVARQLNGKAP